MTNPLVSIIMPCYNEENYIAQAIHSLLDDWVLENAELLVVDGGSEDKTREIVEALAQEFDRKISAPVEKEDRENKEDEKSKESKRNKKGWPFLRILNNSARIQASGMNRGIKEVKGEIIVRADAHCLYPEGYVRRCVKLLTSLEKDGVVNVGGFIKPVGESLFQQAIALALKNPVGVGDSRWHLGRKSGYVDTVYLGTFRKKVLEEIGLYDPKAHPNEDAELNLRLLKSGKKIYLDGSLGVFYFVRDSLKGLAKQYFYYGQGRAYTTLKHGRLTSWRQIAPVAVMTGIGTSLAGGFFWPQLWLIPAAYLAVLAAGAASSLCFEAKRERKERKESQKKSVWEQVMKGRMAEGTSTEIAPKESEADKLTRDNVDNKIDMSLQMSIENGKKQNDITFVSPAQHQYSLNKHQMGLKRIGLNKLSLTQKSSLFFLIMASFAVIHFCWAAGFISKFFTWLWSKIRA